jgi:hypothetical protein
MAPVRAFSSLLSRITGGEETMRAMPDEEVERTPANARRQEMEQKLAVMETKARVLAQRHGRLAVGLALGAAAVFGVGLIVYRRSRRKSLVRRMRSSIPDAAWDLPEELVAQLKKLQQRAAKGL